jgi:hypothetical protein
LNQKANALGRVDVERKSERAQGKIRAKIESRPSVDEAPGYLWQIGRAGDHESRLSVEAKLVDTVHSLDHRKRH